MFNSIYIKILLLRRDLERGLNRRFAFFQKPAYNAEPQNKDRRRFLKLVALGSGAALISKIAGDKLFSSFGGNEHEIGNSKGFKVEEKGNKLVFFNRKGNKLFTLSDEGEMEIGD